mgnify:CR=1 FL=1
MIIWLTGQPNSGKITLSNYLEDHYEDSCIAVLDGDDVRKGTLNWDYTIEGRIQNIYNIQRLAATIDKKDKIVIVAAVAPYRYQREKFKRENNVKEIYLFSNRSKESINYVDDYEIPQENCLYLNTDKFSVDSSIYRIIKYCNA